MCAQRALRRASWLCDAPCRQHQSSAAVWHGRRACCSSRRDEYDHNEFQAWLRVNPLPGITDPPPAASGSAPQQRERQAHRFHWSDAPVIAERCIQRHDQLTWAMQTPGVLVAGTCGARTDEPSVRLQLPQVLAGTHPLLFGRAADARLLHHADGSWHSPVAARPGEESRSLLQALRLLAGAWPPGPCAGSGEAARHGFSIGSQLVVLLSADSAALAIYQEGELARHRVHTGYTVRRQQGKAQTAYQRQGGGECGRVGRGHGEQPGHACCLPCRWRLVCVAHHVLRSCAPTPRWAAPAGRQAGTAWAAASGREKRGDCSKPRPPRCRAGLPTSLAATSCCAAARVRQRQQLCGGKRQAVWAQQDCGLVSRVALQGTCATHWTIADQQRPVMSCPPPSAVRAWNELYHASNAPKPPVDRRDPRWQAAGVGVRRPRLADVERIFAALGYGSLEEG